MSESYSHRVSVTRTTVTAADGVTCTEVHVTEVRGGVPKGGVLNGSPDRAAESQTHGCGPREPRGCDCFDVESSCDEREKAMIAALRAYLRPEQAPDCLRARLEAALDRCCRQ